MPVEHQTAGGSISRLVGGYPNLKVLTCDGCDYEDAHRVMADAFDHARSGAGPALVQASVVRFLSHSLSDDERDYKTESELEQERERDPILLTRRRLMEMGAASEEELDGLHEQIREEVAEAANAALALPWAAPDTITDHLYSTVDPRSDAFASEPRFEEGGPAGHHGGSHQFHPASGDGARPAGGAVRPGRGRPEPGGEPRPRSRARAGSSR